MPTTGAIPPGAIPAPTTPAPSAPAAPPPRVADPTRPVVVTLAAPGPASNALLAEVLKQTAAHTGDGYTTRVITLGPGAPQDATEPRLLHFEEIASLRAWITAPERLTLMLPSQVIPGGGTPAETALAREAERLLAQTAEAQQTRHARLRSEVLAHYADKTPRWWKERFRAALSAPNTPDRLRVLVPISRYSTFVRHSADDLKNAIVAAGHHAQVLTEPDSHSKLTTPAYLGAIASLKPDLLVLINHTRRHMGQAVPPGIPFVCWIQDRMAHLFDASCGHAQGELDFLFGHLHEDLFSQFHYPRRRRAFSFVPASPERFPIAPPPARFSAEIAYVSHQSEPPEALHRRLAPMFASAPAVAKSLDALCRDAAAWLDRAETDHDHARTDRRQLVIEALARVGLHQPDPRLVGTVYGNYLVPLMERMVRHRVLEWTRRIAQRRGWRLALYGKGWQHHPTLAPHASGEVPHGDAGLATVYRSSVVQIHASMNTNAHQRVYECALAGGLMLRRGPSPDADLAKTALMRAAAIRGPVAVAPDGLPVFEAREDGTLFIESHYRLRGLPVQRDDNGVPVYRRTIPEPVRRTLVDETPAYPVECMPDFAFPRADETLFHHESELEAMIERAVTDPGWREATIAAHRAHTLARCTYDAALNRMLGMVAEALDADQPGGAS